VNLLEAGLATSQDPAFEVLLGILAQRLNTPPKTRLRGFSSSRSGRRMQRGPSTPPRATGYRAHPYNIAIGLPDWQSRDPIAEKGGINLYDYCYDSPMGLIDPLGLIAIMHCLRCNGQTTCRFEVNGSNGAPFTANAGPNDQSITPGDPYGVNGPIPPGTYNVLPKPASQGPGFPPGTPSITGPGQAPGTITTPNGTTRNDLRIHGPGHSQGCVTASCAYNPDGPNAVENMMNTYGLQLIMQDVKCCPGKGPSF